VQQKNDGGLLDAGVSIQLRRRSSSPADVLAPVELLRVFFCAADRQRLHGDPGGGRTPARPAFRRTLDDDDVRREVPEADPGSGQQGAQRLRLVANSDAGPVDAGWSERRR